jgi:DMSO/TMAO reductase YedYZ molybdopterin-dependent catalytic subunit
MPLLSVDDLNAATPVEMLREDVVEVGSFYTRSNLEVPLIDPDEWRLSVGGAVANPTTFDLRTLQRMPTVRERVILECAGNFRTLMDPVPGGTPWGIGAAAVADFAGVRARDVLLASGPSERAVEWVFTGSDLGRVDPDGDIPYAFPLEVEGVRDGDAMFVWEMNGVPLPPEHGGPVRLVVPGHYGMRSVKWLVSAEAVEVPFAGHFRRKYRYYGSATEPEAAPVDRIRVRSIVTDPAPGPVVAGPVEVSGVAWSGDRRIHRVEVRVDDGDWTDAEVSSGSGRHAMFRWATTVVLDPGAHTIAARATDDAGVTQPESPPWNRNGYGNNVVHRVRVVADVE